MPGAALRAWQPCYLRREKKGAPGAVMSPGASCLPEAVVELNTVIEEGGLGRVVRLNSILREKDNARDFFERHQDKLVYGSDCADTIGRGPGCQGAQTIAAVRRLSASKEIERKLLYGNAKKLFRI